MKLTYIVLMCWLVVVLWWLMGAGVYGSISMVSTTNSAHMCMPHISVHMFFLIMAAGENEYQ